MVAATKVASSAMDARLLSPWGNQFILLDKLITLSRSLLSEAATGRAFANSVFIQNPPYRDIRMMSSTPFITLLRICSNIEKLKSAFWLATIDRKSVV